MVRKPVHGKAEVYWRQFWGKADEKRAALLKSLHAEDGAEYQALQPNEVNRFILVPGGSESAYLTWPDLTGLFIEQFPGTLTARDGDLVSVDREPLEERMRCYYDPSVNFAEVAQFAPRLAKDTARFDAQATRRALLATSKFSDDRVVRLAYRPLDDRWLYWEGTTKLLDEKRVEFFEQVFPR